MLFLFSILLRSILYNMAEKKRIRRNFDGEKKETSFKCIRPSRVKIGVRSKRQNAK